MQLRKWLGQFGNRQKEGHKRFINHCDLRIELY